MVGIHLLFRGSDYFVYVGCPSCVLLTWVRCQSQRDAGGCCCAVRCTATGDRCRAGERIRVYRARKSKRKRESVRVCVRVCMCACVFVCVVCVVSYASERERERWTVMRTEKERERGKQEA